MPFAQLVDGLLVSSLGLDALRHSRNMDANPAVTMLCRTASSEVCAPSPESASARAF